MSRNCRSRVRRPGLLGQATLGLTRTRGTRSNNPRYNRIIRVDEIEVGAGRNAHEELLPAIRLHSVPAHVRHFEAGGEPPDGPGNHVEPLAVTELLARGEQQLVAQADAQERPLPVERPAQGGQQSEGVEVFHGIVKRPVPGQDDGVGLVDQTGILSHSRRHSEPTEGFLHRAQVAPAVVDDGDHKLPFVEGIWSAIRGLIRVASASARPTALNTASVMWWRLWP